MLLDLAGNRIQKARTHVATGLAPFGIGHAGGAYGGIHIGIASLRDLGQGATVGWIDGGEKRVITGARPGAVDVQPKAALVTVEPLIDLGGAFGGWPEAHLVVYVCNCHNLHRPL